MAELEDTEGHSHLTFDLCILIYLNTVVLYTPLHYYKFSNLCFEWAALYVVSSAVM